MEEAEAEAIASARTIKRPKTSASSSGDESRRRDNQEEGTYMAALRGSRSSLWKLQQQQLNLHNNGGGITAHGSGSNSTAPSSTTAVGSCFKCGMTGHWARECGGHDSSVDRADKFVAAKPCPCGSGTCLVLTSNTAKNPGRMFYRCPLKEENGGCNFFEWCDGPCSKIAFDGQSNAQVPVVFCPCGAGSCLVFVSKSGKNEGQQYYKCPAVGEEALVVSSNGAMSRALFQANLLIKIAPPASNVGKKATGLRTARINPQIHSSVEAKISLLPASNVAKLDTGQGTALPRILLLLLLLLLLKGTSILLKAPNLDL
ncbi:uncharacterized protein LOC110027996 isoform X2 [Phalaenopsis equestris]|uniref:uncharacterized protein LOC110027996 isoform X2 n=1 Tax=Phalaenopsis equestris TaxID=78828 RepID=UPI0009E50CCD|nr:uncharacterized protein LOC110027996 isoform X2 [Phalaenopsis equestris]